MSADRGLILFAHGSRDPRWRQPIEAVAQRLVSRAPSLLVACAYLELDEPDLPAAATLLIGRGATSLTVLPMFLGIGKHAREDMPALVECVKRQHPAVPVTLAPALGEQDALLDFIADAAAQLV